MRLENAMKNHNYLNGEIDPAHLSSAPEPTVLIIFNVYSYSEMDIS